MAAGGILGSGWLFAAAAAARAAGSAAIWSWLIGGALMLLVAAVMVELGTAIQRTGGLILHPLDSSGRLVALIVAAGLWVAYATIPAVQAVAATQGIAHWYPGLVAEPHTGRLTAAGTACAVGLMALVHLLNLMAPRLFVRFNLALTAFKVAVPVLIAALLLASSLTAHHAVSAPVPAGHSTLSAAMSAVVGGGVVFAYIGFQAPLDLAGHVRAPDAATKSRLLRRAVYGTVVATVVLYTLLQTVFLGHLHEWGGGVLTSPYAAFATAASLGWLSILVLADAIVSPAGSALVFSHALTREIAELSHNDLVHGRLADAPRSRIWLPWGRRERIYWAVLAVDFLLGAVLLFAARGNWSDLAAFNSIPLLVVYVLQGVCLLTLPQVSEAYGQRRRQVHWLLVGASFVGVSLVLYQNGWHPLSLGLAGMGVMLLVLLVVPLLLPGGVEPLLHQIHRPEHRLELRPAVPLLGMLVTWLLADLFFRSDAGLHSRGAVVAVGVLVPLLTLAALWCMVHHSRRYARAQQRKIPRGPRQLSDS